MSAVGFEPTPFRVGAWNKRLRPLGQTVYAMLVDFDVRRRNGYMVDFWQVMTFSPLPGLAVLVARAW